LNEAFAFVGWTLTVFKRVLCVFKDALHARAAESVFKDALHAQAAESAVHGRACRASLKTQSTRLRIVSVHPTKTNASFNQALCPWPGKDTGEWAGWNYAIAFFELSGDSRKICYVHYKDAHWEGLTHRRLGVALLILDLG